MADDGETEIKVSVPMAPYLHAQVKALAKKDGRMLGRFIAVKMAELIDKEKANG